MKAKTLSLLLFSTFMLEQVNAQFISATTTESTILAPLYGVENTGNDVGYGFTVAVNDQLITGSVYDSYLSYSSTGSPQYSMQLGAGIISGYDLCMDPDVTLTQGTNQTDTYAITVYYAIKFNSGSLDADLYIEPFKYIGFNAFASCGATLLRHYNSASGPQPGKEINIDGCKGGSPCDGEFVVTWDELDGKVFAVSSNMDNCSHGVSSTSGELIYDPTSVVGRTTGLSIPDVATDGFMAYFTYLAYNASTGQNMVEIASKLVSDISPTPYSPAKVEYTTPVSLFSGFYYNNPRIACESAISGNRFDNLMVVAEETDGYQTAIFGINAYNSSYSLIQYYNIYGYGVCPSISLSNVLNQFPVVTYDGNGDIWISWLLCNLSGSISYPAISATYPVALKLNPDGTLVSGTTDYFEVPLYLFSNDVNNSISIAGRGSSNNLFTFSKIHDANPSSPSPSPVGLYSKLVSNTASALRINQSSIEKLERYEIMDLLGRIITKGEIVTNDELQTKHFLEKLQSGIYLIKYYGNNSTKTIKYFKNN